MRVGIAGEPPVALAEASRGRSGSWNQHGEILFTPNSQASLYRVSETGGTPERVSIEEPDSHRSPDFLPDGRRFLFFRRAGRVRQIRLGQMGSLETEVLAEWSRHAIYVPASDGSNGYLVTVQEGALVAQPFDVATGTLFGYPFPNTISRVGVDPNMERGLFSVSTSGTLAYLAEDVPLFASKLMFVDRKGKPVQRFDLNASPFDVKISPDGNRAAVVTSVGTRPPYSVETVDLREPSSLQLLPSAIGSLAWSPDSRSLALRRREEYIKIAADGSSGAIPLGLKGRVRGHVLDWSRDGRWILFGSGEEVDDDFHLLAGDLNSGEVRPFLASDDAHEHMGEILAKRAVGRVLK